MSNQLSDKNLKLAAYNRFLIKNIMTADVCPENKKKTSRGRSLY